MRSFLLFLCSFFLFVSCEKKNTCTEQKASIIVSLPPYTYFVERIVSDSLSVAPLIPVGSNPHLFEPTPKQVACMNTAKLWVRCRESFENKILKIVKEQNPNIAILDLFEEIADEEEDRHLWLSPKRAKKQAQAIAEALVLLYPSNEAYYRENLTQFLNELDALDKEISFLLAPLKGRAILTSHPAFGYFCEDYGLIQIAIECEGKDPLPQNLQETLRLAQQHKVARVLLQPQHNNKGAELMASYLHLPAEVIDPYSSNYLSNLRALAYLIGQ
jgi:zinc transport system substrate-binding protein